MTCIVALVQDDVIYVGGDSAAIAGWELCARADEKVFLNDEFIIGFCGSFRTGQLMRYAFLPPERPLQKDEMAFMVTDFVDAIRTCQRDKGSLKKEEESESHEASLIVGYSGKIYVIEEDFQVGRPVEDYAAIGSGAQIALGAMFASVSERDPIKRLTQALEAAEKFNAGVRGPFVILTLPPGHERKRRKP